VTAKKTTHSPPASLLLRFILTLYERYYMGITEEKERDEGYEMATQVFLYFFVGCVLFMIASILIGIFEVIPLGPYGDMTK
jgi:hypothetical protein